MWRYFVLGFGVAFLTLNALAADTYKGKVQKVDKDKGTLITLQVDGKEKTFPLAGDAKIYTVNPPRKGFPAVEVPAEIGETVGKEVIVTTADKNDREVITSIKIEQMPLKKKKK